MRQPVRILVVDDDASQRGRLTQALRDAGHQTADCATAVDATRLAATFLPDLLLEMVLGDVVVGPELARRLRANRDPLVIFATSDVCVPDKLAAFDAGADDYVVKPYEIDEVLARVRALLRRSGRLTSQVRQVGPLVIDETAHRATLGDAVIDLGPTDFALLAVMARHANQVLSKRRLLELVWGYDAVDENLVEVHVSSLRRRLGARGSGLIRTVRGVGYVMRDDPTNRGWSADLRRGQTLPPPLSGPGHRHRPQT